MPPPKAKKRARPAEEEEAVVEMPVVDWSLAGTRCIGLRGLEDEDDEDDEEGGGGGGGVASLPALVKSARPDDPHCKDVLVIAAESEPLLAALEAVHGCKVAYSSSRAAEPPNAGKAGGLKKIAKKMSPAARGDAAAAEGGLQWCVAAFRTVKAARRFLRSRPPTAAATSAAAADDDDAGEDGEDGEDEVRGRRGGGGAAVGLSAWLDRHMARANPDSRALQAAADRYMAAFDEKEAGVGRVRTELEARMEQDGFTLVKTAAAGAVGGGGGGGGGGRGSKGHAAIPRSEVDALARASGGSSVPVRERYLSDNQKKKLKRGTLVRPDFYSFHKREGKASALTELKEGFQADRERVARLKEGKAFKAY